MEHNHYPFTTQDWSLIRHRTLVLQATQLRAIESLKGELWVTIDGNCNDYFVKAGDSVNIPCNNGNVVIESTSATAIVRVALAAQSPLMQRVGPTFGDAIAASVLRPLAALLSRTASLLRAVAVQLDPKLSPTKA
jgi:hypothetical protein